MKLGFMAGVVAGLAMLAASVPLDGITGVGNDLPQRKCTPDLKHCSDDGKSLLKCDFAGQWEILKSCTGCCRYGNHGYPDCYTGNSCDHLHPPAVQERDTSDTRIVCNPGCLLDAEGHCGCLPDGMVVRNDHPTTPTALPGHGKPKPKRPPPEQATTEATTAHQQESHETELVVAIPEPVSAAVTMRAAKLGCGNFPEGGMTCAVDEDQGLSYLAVCEKGKWVFTTICGNPNCCDYEPNYTAFCTCPRSEAEEIHRSISIAEPSVHLVPEPRDVNPSYAAGCAPNYPDGAWACAYNSNHSYTAVCQAGTWVPKADCGNTICCEIVPDYKAYCICPSYHNELKQLPGTVSVSVTSISAPTPATIQATSGVEVRDGPQPLVAIPVKCNPGTYTCSANFTQIDVCTADRRWDLSSVCGAPGCCEMGRDGTAYCSCPKKTDERKTLQARDFNSEMPDACTTPGFYTCSTDRSKVGVCTVRGGWKLLYKCDKGSTCIQGEDYTGSCMHTEDDQGCPVQTAAAQSTSAVQARDTKMPAQSCDNPGTYACTVDHSQLAVCSPSHEWILSANCGHSGCCVLGPAPGTAFCNCS